MKTVFLMTLLFTSIFLVPQIARAQMPAQQKVETTPQCNNNNASARHACFYDDEGYYTWCYRKKPVKSTPISISIRPVHLAGKDATKLDLPK